jgi:hypothetical protein
LVVNFPDTKVGQAQVMLLSNTCDVSPDNKRFFPSSLSYVPIFSLDRYLEVLRKRYEPERVNSHERDIRNQLITQIFFLPKSGKLFADSLVFLDRTQFASSDSVDRTRLTDRRLYTLNDFGAWLFALKLSIHFCRFRDKVDRTAGLILL